MSFSSILSRPCFAKTLMISTALAAVFMSPSFAANRLSNGVEIIGDEETGVTLIYGQEFFEQYPSAVTAVDIIERIPGGRAVLDSGGGGQSRGFSNNKDGVLINGRRLTGKGNDSRSALARITLDQVEKVELIRGNSPDIKTAGQSAVINVVTKADASTSSGTYRLAVVSTDAGYVTPGATLTYGGSANKLEYFLSADLKSDSRDPVQTDRFFDANGVLTRELDFDIDNRKNTKTVSANLSYMLDNGNPIRLNAGYTTDPFKHYRYGKDRVVDDMGDLIEVGETFRFEEMNKPTWEVGGDYAADLSENWSFKIIGLYAERGFSFDQAEDYDWDGETFHKDIESEFDRDSTESIGRLSFKYGGFTGHDVEVGSELAINTMDANLIYLERDEETDQLVNVDVAGAVVGVQEERLESFINDTWSFTSKTTVEGAINTEYSKISVDQNPSANRSLFYVKPTLDIRHNLDSQNQIQVTFIRQISQLDFGRFATSVNGDDQVDGGNNQLNPWKAWKSNWGFEHRLADDGGSVSATVFTGHFQDMHGPSEVSPGVTGVANIGKAEEYGVKFKASLRLDKVGMENAVLALNGHVGRARVTNAFTGKKETAPWLEEQNLRLNLRHDITDWGVSYELNAFYTVKNPSWRYGEYSYPVNPNFNFWGSIQKQLNDTMYIRFGAGPALTNNDGRTRVLYAGGIAEGTIQSKEVRKRFNGRRVRLSIHGTF